MSNVTTVQPRAHLGMQRQGNTITPAFESMGQIVDFARVMATSDIGVRKHLRGNHGACIAICLQAQRWGMDPFMVGMKSYSVNDQIAYESQLIAAVVNTRAPIKGRLRIRYDGQGDKRRCIVSATFEGDTEPVEVESPEFARITPKNSPLWKSDPDQQLAYYTQRLFARRHCPEVLLGVYAEDEITPAPPPGPDHARDVTPPRPQRSDYASQITQPEQPERQVVDVEPEPEPAYSLVSHTGEILTWDDPADAERVVEAHEDEVRKGGMAVWNANADLRSKLVDAGYGPFTMPTLV